MLKNERTLEAEGRLENLDEFYLLRKHLNLKARIRALLHS